MSSVIDAKEFKTTDYEACKLHFMKLYELSEMQFDVFYYNRFAGRQACVLSVQDGQLFTRHAYCTHISNGESYVSYSDRYTPVNKNASFIKEINDIKKYNAEVFDLLSADGQKQMLIALYKERYRKKT